VIVGFRTKLIAQKIKGNSSGNYFSREQRFRKDAIPTVHALL